MCTVYAIEGVGLTQAYGEHTVLDGVDIRVPEGSVYALLGPNGAGKTTTVRILSTLLAPQEGSASVAGHDVVRDRGQVRRLISLTGQYTALDEPLTGRENLEMIGGLIGLTRAAARKRTKELLKRFDLVAAGDRRVGTYSGGMRRRLDLAAGLLGEPRVVFLDEPSTGLDPRSRQDLWTLISRLAASGVTVFLTTQYLEEADALADRIAVLDGGRIVAEGTSGELKDEVAGQRLELRLTHEPAFKDIVDRLGRRALRIDPATLTVAVATSGEAAQIRRLLDELDPLQLNIARFALHRATLDDVFLTLTRHRPESRVTTTHA
jgi:ABC-2 type transport system ATP-binding protein